MRKIKKNGKYAWERKIKRETVIIRREKYLKLLSLIFYRFFRRESKLFMFGESERMRERERESIKGKEYINFHILS